jgi:hypothetical protein
MCLLPLEPFERETAGMIRLSQQWCDELEAVFRVPTLVGRFWLEENRR